MHSRFCRTLLFFFTFIWKTQKDQYRHEERAQKRSAKLTQKQLSILHEVRGQIRDIESLGDGFGGRIKQISFDEIVFKKQIGSGKFGVVFLGSYRNIDVAVKQIMPESASRRSIMQFVAEILILSSLTHPNIIQFLGSTWGPTPEDEATTPQMCLMTEYAKRGSLKSVLRSNRALTWHQHKRSFLVDICSGIAYLHHLAKPVIHRDLTTDNCLVTESE